MNKEKKLYPMQEKLYSDKQASDGVEKFFKDLEEKLKDVPEDVLQGGGQKIKDFLAGNSSWVDLFEISEETMMQIADLGYTHFNSGRYGDAERFFKVLTFLDWDNPYYHAMMGAVLQNQKRFGEAIVEYTQALEQAPNDLISLTNRGEIFFKHGWLKQAEQDFSKAIKLDPKGENQFANRARMLKIQLLKNQESKKEE